MATGNVTEKNINNSAAIVGDSLFNCSPRSFLTITKHMSFMSVKEYNENEEKQLLSHTSGTVLPDFKLCSRLSLLRNCVRSKKHWALKIERQKAQIQEILSFFDQCIQKQRYRDGSHWNRSTGQSMRILSKSQRKAIQERRALRNKHTLGRKDKPILDKEK